MGPNKHCWEAVRQLLKERGKLSEPDAVDLAYAIQEAAEAWLREKYGDQ